MVESRVEPAVKHGTGIFLFVVLGGLSAIAPASTDMYSPAFPNVSKTLHASTSAVQLTLSLALLGLGLGQLIVGPLSDRFGRRRLLLVAAAGYALASAACGTAPTIEILCGLRLVQGLLGGSCIVIALATVQDLHPGTSSARYLSRLQLIIGIAPVVAPSIGAGMLHFTDWRGIFVLQSIVGAALLLSSWAVLPESLAPSDRRSARLSEIGSTMGGLLRDRIFLGYVLCNCLASATLFAYIGSFSFLIQDSYHRSSQLFGVLYGINALGFVLVAQLNAHIVSRTSPRSPLVRGLVISSLAAIVFPLLAGVLAVPLVVTEITVFVIIASRGLVMANSTSLAMARTPAYRGSAAAVLGSLRYVFGALASPLSGIGHKSSALPMAIVLASFTTAALGAGAILARTPPGTDSTLNGAEHS